MPSKGETWIFRYVGAKGAHTVKILASSDTTVTYQYKGTPPKYLDRTAPTKTFTDMYKKHETNDLSSYPTHYRP